MTTKDWEYTLDETIAQLQGWRRRLPMYPIDVAISAKHWFMQRANDPPRGAFPMSFAETRAAIDEWLQNEMPELPEDVALATLYWLRQCKGYGTVVSIGRSE